MIIKLQDQLSPHLHHGCYEAKLYQNWLDLAGPGTIVIISRRQTICRSLVCQDDNIVLIKPTKAFYTTLEEFKHHRMRCFTFSFLSTILMLYIYILKFTYIRFCKILRI